MLITINGKTKLLCEWITTAAVSHSGYYLRIHRGMAPEQALFSPRRQGRRA